MKDGWLWERESRGEATPGKGAGFLAGGSRELQDGFGAHATEIKDFDLERACLGFFMTFGELGAQHSIRDVVWLLSRHPQCREEGLSAEEVRRCTEHNCDESVSFRPYLEIMSEC